MTPTTEDRIRIESPAADPSGSSERQELRAALAEAPPRIPSHYHYDDVGSALFAEITRLPEYYLTRAELALLRRHGAEIAAATRASTLIELGPGDATKTRPLLDALRDQETLATYAPFDVDRGLVERVAAELATEYPRLRIHGLVGNILTRLDLMPAGDRRLIAFLGSTIGNLQPDEAAEFLRRLRAELTDADQFLLGIDLIKEIPTMEAAYNDAAGVTWRFSRNILAVMNRRFGFDFDLDAYTHRSVWSAPEHRIETSVVAVSEQRVRSGELGVELVLAPGDAIRTEISTKYDRPIVDEMLVRADLQMAAWITDAEGSFALALVRLPR